MWLMLEIQDALSQQRGEQKIYQLIINQIYQTKNAEYKEQMVLLKMAESMALSQ